MSKVLASRLREAVLVVDFFWDRLHWVPQSILFLPKEEGGQGLVHLASRARCLSAFSSYRDSSPDLQTWFGGVYPAASCRVWILLRKQRREQADSLYWLLQEPVLFGGFLDCPSWSGPTLSRLLRAAGVSTLGQVVELAGPRLDDPVGLAAQLGLRSTRIMGQILKHWRQKLTAEQFLLLNDFCYGSLQQNCEDPFPSIIRLFPDFKNCSGPLLELADSVGVSLEDASGKTLYRLVVKTLNRSKLNDRTDTPWRTYLNLGPDVKPAWRSLYKPPLTKKHADLQWRILHGIVAVNSFISVINAAVEDKCPFCGQRETVYTRQHKKKCQILNFVLGQAKMAVYLSRRRKVEEDVNIDVVPVFVNMHVRGHRAGCGGSGGRSGTAALNQVGREDEQAVVLFLDQVDQGKPRHRDRCHGERHEMFVPVLPLTQPATKVILSNVPPFITDEFLSRELSRHGKVSPIRKILSGCKSAAETRGVSPETALYDPEPPGGLSLTLGAQPHRRQLYMILNHRGEELSLTGDNFI
ncbi:hypothetical protein L3Q82_007029 [Scortum barcoo]|uniref:Uncharacterized protein n=1 Tax=Scortum barcoo TaxID=214431 RepID=A0ACB8WWY5_9TELE|nr:hypothetical protein L3Q82_007029 [Scortum barcoo]